MKENNLVKILIPIIAVVVVVESVILVSNLSKNENIVMDDVTPTEEVEEVKTPVADFVFATDTKEMKVGKPYEVVLNLVGKQDLALDGIESYIKYDPSKITVSKLVLGKTLPKPEVSKIDTKLGLISNAILIDDIKGYAIKSNEINKIVSFTVVPKEEGLIDMELITSSEDKKSVTMIVETTTSKSLTFSSNKLEINATK